MRSYFWLIGWAPYCLKPLEEATTILKSRRISRAGIKEEGKQLPTLSS
jgi:hypothetical protein